MKELEVFADLRLDKGNDFLSITGSGQVIMVEFSNLKVMQDFQPSPLSKRFMYGLAIKLHKFLKTAGLEVIIKTPHKKIISLGNTSFYRIKLVLLKIVKLFS